MSPEGKGRPGSLRELLGGVELLVLAVEVGVAHAERVVVAAVGVAVAGEAVLRVGTTATVGLADVVVVVLARVRRESKSVGVGLPDVDLGAATAVWTDTGVGVVGRRCPAVEVGLAADKFEITSALSVAVLWASMYGQSMCLPTFCSGSLTPVPYLAPALLEG